MEVCNHSLNDSIFKELENQICRLNITKLFSVGVGRAVLEYNIKSRNEKLEMVCSYYTPQSIARLRNVFPECDKIILFDILNGSWNEYSKYTILMNRISTEFSISQWRNIFKLMYENQIAGVLFIPTEDLTIKLAIKEKIINFRELIKGNKLIDCGRMYSREMIISFWDTYYNLSSESKIGNTSIYYLERNKSV